ncbi:MAG: NADP-dependent oxidoreductase [Candidatus Liptonbacteria bacterium]|nr:NADP-dependent oxidoreductase [Candidatus Liptonbacteria bacterium]
MPLSFCVWQFGYGSLLFFRVSRAEPISHGMKAAQIDKFGSVEAVFINSQASLPKVKAGELLVKVCAAGVNPVDWKIREGFIQPPSVSFPLTLGGDFSGKVVEVGGNVAGFEEGDLVYGTASTLSGGSGAFAEFAIVKKQSVAHTSHNVGTLQAAALPLAGVSAYQALIEHIGISRGHTILVHGGAGGIGMFAIQIAKHMGVKVFSTAREEDLEFVQGLGADQIIDYAKTSFDDHIQGVDAVLDTVGGETYARSFRVLRQGGTLVSLLETPDKKLAAQYKVHAISQSTEITADKLTRLAKLVDAGAIDIKLDKIFPLDQAPEAIAHVERGHKQGKVVIEVFKDNEDAR